MEMAFSSSNDEEKRRLAVDVGSSCPLRNLVQGKVEDDNDNDDDEIEIEIVGCSNEEVDMGKI
jgi:hypothetical protein